MVLTIYVKEDAQLVAKLFVPQPDREVTAARQHVVACGYKLSDLLEMTVHKFDLILNIAVDVACSENPSENYDLAV